MEQIVEILSVMIGSIVFIVILAIVTEYINYRSFISVQKEINGLNKLWNP